MAAKRISDDPDMIERMEADLVQKVEIALGNVPDLPGLGVQGVFSIDHLEQMLAANLCNEIGVGIGYFSTDNNSGGNNVDGGRSASMVEFKFVVVLAVPTEESCGTRHNATRLLTLMRRGIAGTPVGGDSTNRGWRFLKEQPEISASTKQMLYYSQVWQVALPNLGNLP